MNYYTENFSDFGYRERDLLIQILNAWHNNGLPEDFGTDNVRPAFNRNSGYVFLVNDDCQVCMESDGKLEIWHTLPYGGEEGFLSELLELDPETLHADDIEYIQHYEPSYGTEEAQQ